MGAYVRVSIRKSEHTNRQADVLGKRATANDEDGIAALSALTPTVAKNLAVLCSPAKKTRLPTGVRNVLLQWITGR